jgi:Flp pilus assembly protein TadD
MRCLLALAVAAVVSCGGPPGYRERADRLFRAGDLEAAIEELRFGVANHPKDGAAQAELARLQDRAGRPGAALRHYQLAARLDALDAAASSRLAELYLERARARLALGDGNAWRDIEAARKRSRRLAIDPALRRETLLVSAIAGLRSAERRSRARARRRLRELAAVAPDDPRVALLRPEAADASTLGVAAAWAWDGGARRVGYEALDRYIEAGGRAPAVVQRWLAAKQWWRGSEARISPLIVDDVARAGADVCVTAVTPDDRSCTERAVDSDALLARARQLHWRTQHPRLAGVFVEGSLRAWAHGDAASWLGEIAERVDLDALPAARDWPAFAAATLWRARGNRRRAADALDDAIRGAASLTPSQRAVVLAEAAAQGRDAAAVADIAVSGPVPAYAWIAPAAAARAAGDRALELERLEQAGSLVFDYLAGHGDLPALVGRFGGGAQGARYRRALARWRDALSDSAAAPGLDAIEARWPIEAPPTDPPPTRFGSVDAAALAYAMGLSGNDAVEGLAAIAAGFARDRAVVRRLADDYVDRTVAAGERTPAVVGLLLRLGDPDTAVARATALLEVSPRHPRYLRAAGEAAAAAGDIEQADVHFIAAAATSGDAGAENLAAARLYLEYGHPMPAVAALRRAVELTAPGEDQVVLRALARALLAAGRREDAEAALVRYIERIPAPFRDRARSEVLAMWAPGEPPASLATGDTWRSHRDAVVAAGGEGLAAANAADPADPVIAVAYAATLGAGEAGPVLDRAIAWCPGHVGARAARLRVTDPSDPRYATLVAELVAIAVAATDDAARRAALDAVATAADAMGAVDLGTAARREQ